MSIMLIFDVLIIFVLVIAQLSKLTITKCAKVGNDGNWWEILPVCPSLLYGGGTHLTTLFLSMTKLFSVHDKNIFCY